MSLKFKAIKSFSWTAFEMIFSQGIIFVVGIILARILSPRDFGIIGIITAFVAISNSIIEGGFVSALLRKMDANDKDYNTVFYTNMATGTILYALLVLFSHQIADYFEIPVLSEILIYSGLILIINGVTIIQRTILTKQLDFKTLAIISIISSVISGLVAVLMAYNDYGIWSLVMLSILKPLINSVLLWFKNRWRPAIQFSKNSFKDLFDYGYKLLVANLINTIYRNIYYVLIGKLFSPVSLGYYTRAEQFQTPVSSKIALAINKISFPILSKFQNDDAKLKGAFIKFIRFSIFLNFTVMLSIAALAKPIVLLLIGEKWTESIEYLQLLCIPGMLYPLQILHLNLLLVKGHSNLNLKLEIVKKIILIPLIYVSVFYGVKAMIYALIIFSVIEYFINSYYTKWLIKYSIIDQFKDILPFLSLSFTIFLSMYVWTFFEINLLLLVILQLITGALVFLIINEFLKLNEYMEGRTITFNLIKKLKSRYE